MELKRVKRRLAWDNNGAIGIGTLLFVLFPSALTLGMFTYEEYIATEPLITPETAPTLAGVGIDSLWVIVALISAVSILIWIAFGRASPRKS